MNVPYSDPSLPSGVSPIFSDVDAARGDQLRANNGRIWGNFTTIFGLFDASGNANNAVTVSGKAIGNASGNVPLANGTKCANLFAEMASKLVPVVVSGTSNLCDTLAATAEQFSAFTSSTTSGVPVSGRTYVGYKMSFYANQAYIVLSAYDTDNKAEFRIQRINGVWETGPYNGWTMITDANGNPYKCSSFDLVIDSNAALSAWATSGTYARVLIKAGTWTLASGGVNLFSRGTKEVVGEPGSLLVFSNASAGLLNGASLSEFRAYGVNVQVSNTSNHARAFENCINLVNCSGTGTSSYVSAEGTGFSGCYNLVNCKGTGSGGCAIPAGFVSCTSLVNCSGSGSKYGFYACTSLSNCEGTGTNSSSASYGFASCTQVAGCRGVGLGTTTGYGFYSSKKCVNNKAAGTSTTSTYNTSYADAGTSAACADTAAGGWNS